ncbi:right-handed parallel beta-helix repeat-containing protein [Sphingomonas sp. SRS2]|uniref:right-handed parallel beta-helix repeat-containing protein n=1 Tax=Sphingomonas sp. SRS2 TaxID=133190 RepID=UPI00061847C0|nr:right-handed parallel beta-helix repeat-containing protein [Sphingomonas sp. SRS2]KKC25653.1 hypothetical protein WP12_12645 [Sphingomonas sp. SRS2]
MSANRPKRLFRITDAPFNATGDGIADDSTAIQAAIAAAGVTGGTIWFPPGRFRHADTLALPSDIELAFADDAELIFTNSATRNAITATGKSRIVFSGARLTGSGAAGRSAVLLTGCHDISFDNCVITRSGSMAIQLERCSSVKVDGSNLSNNYYYGISDRDGVGNRFIDNLCASNGDTGVATSAGGRGINLWRCINNHVAGNRLVSNTEYGFRIYSEAADTSPSSGNIVAGNYFSDNVRSDLVLYDESLTGSLVLKNVIADNVSVRTVDTTLGIVFLLHGGQNIIDNNHARSGAFSADAAFSFYHSFDCVMLNCSATRFAQAVSFSGSERITVDNFLGDGVGKAATILLKDITIRNSRFVHGGAGTTDIAIDLTNTPIGRNWIDGCRFDGFHTGIYTVDVAVSLFRNKTVNSGFAGFRKGGHVTSVVELADNEWDKVEAN